jgi:hypothetical protein
LTDDERGSLVRAFVAEAVEGKGSEILRDLPDVDPRVWSVITEFERRYDHAEEPIQGDQGGAGPAGRGEADASAAQLAKELEGHVRVIGGKGDQDITAALNKAFRKSALRKVN